MGRKLKFLLACCILLAACASAPPRTLDDLLDAPVASVEHWYGPGTYLRCYQLGDSRFINLDVDEGDPRQFWSVELADVPECATTMAPNADMPSTFKVGVDLGDTVEKALSILGRPDEVLKEAPEGSSDAAIARFKRLGGIEYIFRCKAPATCGTVTSIFARDGKVSAVSVWYSD